MSCILIEYQALQSRLGAQVGAVLCAFEADANFNVSLTFFPTLTSYS